MRARFALLVVLAAFAAALVGCTSSHHQPSYHASMAIAPTATRIDQPFTMTLRGLPAGTSVDIDASAVDYQNATWTSKSTFHVPSNGVLTLNDPAVSGSYTGADPLGPLLTLSPPSGSSSTTFSQGRSGAVLRLTAVVKGTTVAQAQLLRQNSTPSIVDTPLRPAEGGLYGELFTPKTASPHPRPGIVVFGGSEGGDNVPAFEASILAADGYPALALAYFAEPGLPGSLHNIPLEYFERAVQRVHAAPGVDPHHVVVFGVSRGGEAALLLGATYPTEINAVIAGVPSSQVNEGFPQTGEPAWTLHGQPVAAGTPIAVEQIRGPILQVCATDDQIWTSCTYQQQITQRLQDNHFPYSVTSLRFTGAGHTAGGLTCCFSALPLPDTGGTQAANALAQVQGSAALQAFLARL